MFHHRYAVRIMRIVIVFVTLCTPIAYAQETTVPQQPVSVPTAEVQPITGAQPAAEGQKKERRDWLKERVNAAEMYGGLYQVRLLGDARVQALSDEANGAFGGGLEYNTLQWFGTFLIRAGTDDGIMDSPAAIGRHILAPVGFGRPALELEGRLHPWTTTDGKFAYAGVTPQPGFRAYLHASQTSWRTTFNDEEVTQAVNVTALGFQFGGRLVFVADNTNFIDLHLYTGPTMRIMNGDGVLLRDRDDDGKRFYEVATGSSRRGYFGMDALTLLARIRSLAIGFNFSYFSGSVPGLSGLQYVATVKLTDGPGIRLNLPEAEKE